MAASLPRNTHTYSDGNTHLYSNCYSNLYSNVYSNLYANAYRNCHGYGGSQRNRYCHGNGHSYADRHPNGNGQCHTQPDTYRFSAREHFHPATRGGGRQRSDRRFHRRRQHE